MSILTIQKRLHERGRIRIGRKVATSNGNSRPSKLEHFRFTSADKDALDQAAVLWGGEVTPWDAPAGKQWEVFSEADDIPVVVPPADFGFSQFMELWSGGGCQRRCDGNTELITGAACVCALEDKQVCKPTTRLSVILPDIPGLGLWRLESHGWNAAAELAGTIDLIASHGRLLPARLRLQQRSSIVDGKTSRFAVPVLDIDMRMGELASGAKAIDFASGEIGPGPNPHITPVPVAELAEGPTASIREQVEDVATPPARAPRANAAQEIPSTGLKPRTAAEAEAGESAASTSSERSEPAAAADGPVDWIERINQIGDSKNRAACMKAFRHAFPDLSVPAGEEANAQEIVGGFESISPGDADKLRRGLMAEATKAFPDKSTREAQRHALSYVVLKEHKSASDMTPAELAKVSQWLRDVVEGRVDVENRDGVWTVIYNGQAIAVPAEVAA